MHFVFRSQVLSDEEGWPRGRPVGHDEERQNEQRHERRGHFQERNVCSLKTGVELVQDRVVKEMKRVLFETARQPLNQINVD